MNDTNTSKLDEWALVELFGHQQIVGKVSECALAGGAFLRVDVPALGTDKPFTRFFSPGAVYSINPVAEDVARGLLTQSRFRNEPVDRWQMPQLAEKVAAPEEHEPDSDYCPDCREMTNNCTCP